MPAILPDTRPNTRARRVILVTGAPRTATTPVGNMLALAAHTRAIYEPFGRTGYREIKHRFPMTAPEDGLTPEALSALLQKISRFQGGLKPQHRGAGSTSLKARLFGTRTLYSLRMARLRPQLKNVIWKDPHAVMLVPDMIQAGLPVVVTARRPKAHAGSYKRLGWQSRAAEIYPRWKSRFGADPVAEQWLPEIEDPVISGALIWRLSYLPLIRENCLDRVQFITADALQADEDATYRKLCDALELKVTPAMEKQLKKRKSANGRAIPGSGTTHDWTRSVETVNSYWKKLLTDEETAAVDALTGSLETQLFASPCHKGSAS